MDEDSIVLSVKDLQKTIGGTPIIHRISFDVQKGEVFGFLGPNGAGKTTTIRMIVGLIQPSGGKITICGHDLQENFVEAMAHVGCIVENPEMYKYLTGRENLEQFMRMIDGVSLQRMEEVVRFVGLEKRIDDKVKTYSLGMRQRLGIAQALLAKPDLLILDEPTNGLDPFGIRELRGLVRQLAEQEGVSVFISSHLLHEIEMMCDSVAIIHKGRCLYSGSVHSLTNWGQSEVLWTVSPLKEAYELIKNVSYVQKVEVDKDSIRCNMKYEKIPELNEYMVQNGIHIYSIKQVNQTLEDLFIEMTGGDRIA